MLIYILFWLLVRKFYFFILFLNFLDQQEIAASAKDYLDKTDLSEFEPVDNSIQSVLSYQPEFSERFKKNYSKWLEEEVFKKSIDWERILINSQGIANKV